MATTFALHTEDTAPEAARPLLAEAAARLGYLPNLFRVLAEAPAALAAYIETSRIAATGRLTPAEQQVVALAVSIENGCTYCVASHSAAAQRIGLDEAALAALREGCAIPDPRLQALRRFAERLSAGRGRVPDEATDAFLAAGFANREILEVVMLVALKVLSNYASHFANPPLNEGAKPFAWESFSSPVREPAYRRIATAASGA